jgi:putative peptidoglycan lipid II flippase
MTLASRVFGLIRDVLIGRIFGATVLNSNFQAAFALPNMFRRLFGEGALSAAFIPQYTQAEKADPQQAHRLASLTMVWLATITSGLTILVEIALTVALLVGHHSDERRLLIQLVMVMLPFMPLICMVAILAGMLQVHGRFAAAASGPLVLNGFIIGIGAYSIATDWKAGTTIAFVLGIATVLSAATQLWWFSRLLRPHVRWTWQYRDPAVRKRARVMMLKFVPVAIGLGTLQLNTFLDTTIATFPIWFDTARKGIPFPLDDSSNGILALTSRLYQFPLGVFGIAVASAAFPLLARHADDRHKFTETLRRGLRLSLFIGLPATLGLILVRHELTAVLFGYGKKGFTPEGLARSAAVLAGFAPGVWAYSLNHVYTRAFYARGDTRTPMKISILSMLVNLTLNLTLIWWLREAGMAWATGTAAMAQCVVLTVLARRRLTDGPVIDPHTRAAFGKVIAASVLMAVAVWLTRTVMPGASTWTGQAVTLIASCSVGIGAYLMLSLAMRVHELRWLVSRKEPHN